MCVCVQIGISNCKGPDVCACVSVCDVVTSRYCLREHAGEERKERKDVLGDG